MPLYHGECLEKVQGGCVCVEVPSGGTRKRHDQQQYESSRLIKPDNFYPMANWWNLSPQRVFVYAKGPGACWEEKHLGRYRFKKEKGEISASALEVSLKLMVRSEKDASFEYTSFPSFSP